MPATPAAVNYRKDIDGLRAIAVLSVVVHHYFPSLLRGGFVGVDIFFVISGYLITQSILIDQEAKNFSLANFYARRIRRIFPALILVVATTLGIAVLFMPPDDLIELARHAMGGVAFVSNILLWLEAGYFDSTSLEKPFLHLWSLCVEEQFYIIWPVMIMLTYKGKYSLYVLTVSIIVASFWVGAALTYSNPTTAFYWIFTRSWELLVGAAIPIFSSFYNHKIMRLSEGNQKRAMLIGAIFGLVLVVSCMILVTKSSAFPGFWALLPVLGTALIIATGPDTALHSRILSFPILVWFGLISFSLYLWHWPLLTLLRLYLPSPPENSTLIILAMISIVLAWLTTQIEGPIRRRKHHSADIFVLSASMAAIFCFSAFAYMSNGLPQRDAAKAAFSLYSSQARMAEAELVKSFKKYYGEEGSEKPLIVVIGDSYLHNWSIAIGKVVDLERFDVLALSYRGCDVSFSNGRVNFENRNWDADCADLQLYLNDPDVISRAHSIFLVSHRPFSYSSNAFRFDLIRHLSAANPSAKVFVFGNYFQLDPALYPSCERLMYRTGQGAQVCLDRATQLPTVAELERMPLYPKDIDFSYIDFAGELCGASKQSCPVEADGVPFMLDWNHLTARFLEMALTQVFAQDVALQEFLKDAR